MIPLRSRIRAANKDEGARKPKGDDRIYNREIPDRTETLGGQRTSGPGQRAIRNPAILRGKSQHQAIRHVQGIVLEGCEWCAAIDLKSFFDEIPHDLILKLIRRRIADERFVMLVSRALKAGVKVGEKYEKTTKGCPQGSRLSPMLSNIVLNELDQELEKRGHRYFRWADDFLILVKSERAARRVMAGIVKYLEKDLGLPVNKEKSKVACIKDVPFFGFQVLRGKIRISNKARTKFKKKVRELIRRNNPLSMHQITKDLNRYLYEPFCWEGGVALGPLPTRFLAACD